MQSVLLLVATVTIATALVFPGSSYRYSCNWNTGQYKCTHVRCSHSFDGKENCSTSVTNPNVSGGPRIISMGTPVTNRYSCDWNTGSYKCTHTHCIHYYDGNKNCTTKVTTPNDQAGAALRSNQNYQIPGAHGGVPPFSPSPSGHN